MDLSTRLSSFCANTHRYATALWVGVTLAAVVAVGCSTPRPKRLPPLLQGETDVELLRQHQAANQAYARCHDAHSEALPWHALTSSGLALGGAAVAGAGTATAVVFADDPLLLSVGVGVAASSTALFALAAQQALSIPDDLHRGQIRDAALVQARTETMDALDKRDAAGLERVKRHLYENCRVADIAIDGDAGDVLLRDYARYRREAEAQRRWVDDLKARSAAGEGADEAPNTATPGRTAPNSGAPNASQQTKQKAPAPETRSESADTADTADDSPAPTAQPATRSTNQ